MSFLRLGLLRPGNLGQRTSHTWSSVGHSGHMHGLVFAVREVTAQPENSKPCGCSQSAHESPHTALQCWDLDSVSLRAGIASSYKPTRLWPIEVLGSIPNTAIKKQRVRGKLCKKSGTSLNPSIHIRSWEWWCNPVVRAWSWGGRGEEMGGRVHSLASVPESVTFRFSETQFRKHARQPCVGGTRL